MIYALPKRPKPALARPAGERLLPRAGHWLSGTLGAAREYTFADTWRVAGALDQVAEVLLDTATLAQWWPQLVTIELSNAGDSRGLARKFASRARGFLPYVLNLEFQVVGVEFPNRFAVELAGDLQGQGGGSLRQEGAEVAIDLHLSISVARPLLGVLSVLARPLLCAQHRWVMRQGERGLARELSRRRAFGGMVA
jgi:hypothetical protein